MSSADEDADIAALTSAAAIEAVGSGSAATPAASSTSDPPKDDTPVSSAPIKEERKVGKLNLAAFAPPAANDDKKDPPPTRTVGKLTTGKLNIPIFAPGAAPPPGAGAGAPTTTTTTTPAERPERRGSVLDRYQPAQPPTPADESASSTSSAASPHSRPGTLGGPGKLQANSLMTNLNAMLVGGPRKVRGASMTAEEGANLAAAAGAHPPPPQPSPPPTAAAASQQQPDESAKASGSAAVSSQQNTEDGATPAPTITHAKRAKVARRTRTKAADLVKGEVTVAFQEVKKVDATSPIASKITLVSVPTTLPPLPPGPPPKRSPKSENKKSTDESSWVEVEKDNHDAIPSAAAAPLPTSTPPPSSSSSSSLAPSAAFNAAAMYGDYVEQEYDPLKSDEYRLLTSTGTTFLKHGSSGKPHERIVFVTDSLVLYYSELSKRNKPDPKSSINLSLFTIPKIKLVKGKTTPNFQRSHASKVDDNLCLSIIAKERQLDLQAKSVEERDTWYAAIQYILALAQERREAALLTSAMG